MARIGSFSLKALFRGEKAGVAALTAVMLTAMIGLMAAAVDLGMLYAARTEVQNAADAAALAGANTMITPGQDGLVVAQPEVGLSTAQQISLANEARNRNLALLGEDVTMGVWDFDLGGFTLTGMSGNPDDLTAFQATVRRDDAANTPVTTFFAGIVGINTVDVTATSVAFRGYPGNVPQGGVDLPIAVHRDAVSGGDGPDCGKVISFHSENNENGEWTTFFTWPSNNNTVDDFITGDRTIPALQVGDRINVTNGNLSNNTFRDLKRRFSEEAVDTNGDGAGDSWEVLLPVVDPGHCQNSSTVEGFTTMVITEVKTAPYKEIRGWLRCRTQADGSSTGGGNFGTRSAFSKLVQ